MNKKELARLKRHRRIRIKMQGSGSKPRLVVKRSLNNLSAQVIDDTENKVLFSFSTASKEFKKSISSSGSVKAAGVFGEVFSKMAKEKGISKIIFDRAGYLYHGRIKAFAESLRKGGLEF
ncbi:MAG: 50S ribosomal protein L18 [Candidatus Omnitrophica bacterium]|nr:50S ribosomal protein L18 [Candidatus Omnitrophota bacterium]